MGSLLRFLLEAHCYHVTTRTRGGAPVFRDPANARIIVDALQFMRRHRAYLLGYAILPAHLHSFLVPRGQQDDEKLRQSGVQGAPPPRFLPSALPTRAFRPRAAGRGAWGVSPQI